MFLVVVRSPTYYIGIEKVVRVVIVEAVSAVKYILFGTDKTHGCYARDHA